MHIQHDKHDLTHTCPVWGDDEHARRWVDQSVWARPDMQYSLAKHDIKAVYKFLQRFGVAQRKIAGRPGQSQSEISEVISGRRSYDVQVRSLIWRRCADARPQSRRHRGDRLTFD